MKKLVLSIILTVVLMTGCGTTGGKTAGGKLADSEVLKDVPKEDLVFSGQFSTVSEYPMSYENIEALYLVSLAEPEPLEVQEGSGAGGSLINDYLGIKTDWPAEYLHPDMPVYTWGKITGWNTWGPENPYNLFIIIKNTSEADLEEYRRELEARGFSGSSDYYKKDDFSIEFQFNSKSTLQISSYRIETMDWPDELAFMPPPEKGKLVDFTLTDGEDSVYGELFFTDMTEDDVLAYEELLLEAGFTRTDYLSYSIDNVSFDGKKYGEFSGFFEGYSEDEWLFYYDLEY
ncbi:MAG TPA: hypothetical protein PK369_09240 [Thermoclostridium sp.]|nr:hypothetical protein [Clostridiaceae bacterium]HOQ76735.1 hypothetical protein [Thermoclostridium sp.]